jgi:deoxycytidylate deaminase
MTLHNPALIIKHMQSAVDTVLLSEHAVNRIGACIFNEQTNFTARNHRPACLHNHFAWDARLGVSSQFIHAEMAAIAGFKGTLRGAHMCVTDPFCPNCAKNMAEAGVRSIYIDHKGFQKDFINRNGDEFASMSMLIAEKAGISVYMVNRRESIITPILEQAAQTRPTPSALEFFDIDKGMTLETAVTMFRKRFSGREAWSVGFIKEADGTPRGLLVFEALPPGFTPEDYKARGKTDTGKYRFPLDPVTRLLLTGKRMNFTWGDNRIGCSHAPSSRAIVNSLGFGMNSFILSSHTPDHDATGQDVLKQLQALDLITVTEVP